MPCWVGHRGSRGRWFDGRVKPHGAPCRTWVRFPPTPRWMLQWWPNSLDDRSRRVCSLRPIQAGRSQRVPGRSRPEESAHPSHWLGVVETRWSPKPQSGVRFLQPLPARYRYRVEVAAPVWAHPENHLQVGERALGSHGRVKKPPNPSGWGVPGCVLRGQCLKHLDQLLVVRAVSLRRLNHLGVVSHRPQVAVVQLFARPVH